MNKIYWPITLVLITLIFGGFYYVIESKKINKEQSLNEIKKQEEVINETKPEPEVFYNTEKKEETSIPDYKMIILDFKVDNQELDGLMNIIMNSSQNNPSQFCSSVIAERTTQQNAYYFYVDGVTKLKTKYSQYLNHVEEVRKGLNLNDQIIQIVKDKCMSIGYEIK